MKYCSECVHYGQLFNHGVTMCNCGAFDEEEKCPFDAEKCDYYYPTSVKQYAHYVDSMIVAELQNGDTHVGKMAQYRINRAKRKRKNEHGVKHGRRK